MEGEASVTGSSSNPDAPALQSPELSREEAGTSSPGWKDEIAARVRARRGNRSLANQPSLPGMEEAFSPEAIAARVAERYARLPSWREMLAAQAAKSTVDSMGAAAGPPPPTEPAPQQLSIATELALPETSSAEPEPEPYQPDLLRYSVSVDSLPEARSAPPEAHAAVSDRSTEYPADPLENAVIEPTLPLPATLITTPRELVAPRKARPRLAEGPLSVEGDSPESVVHEQQTVANPPADQGVLGPAHPDPEFPLAGADAAVRTSGWNSIHLDTEAPIRERRRTSPPADALVLHVASLEDRAMAALVDCALTLCAFLLFSAVFALSSTALPHGRSALIGAIAALSVMALLYQLLFFTLTDATPGMRHAKLALCTFDDENPSRSILRGRIAALLLSALPLGLGFLWAAFDEDSLGWHDRITRTYQRSYRDE